MVAPPKLKKKEKKKEEFFQVWLNYQLQFKVAGLSQSEVLFKNK